MSKLKVRIKICTVYPGVNAEMQGKDHCIPINRLAFIRTLTQMCSSNYLLATLESSLRQKEGSKHLVFLGEFKYF